MTTEEILWNHAFEREPDYEEIESVEIDEVKQNMELLDQFACYFRPNRKNRMIMKKRQYRKQPIYSRITDLEYINLLGRENEIYNEIRTERRTLIVLLILFFISLALSIYGILRKDSKKAIPPITVVDHQQLVELQSYHSDKGLTIIDDGYIVIKK